MKPLRIVYAFAFLLGISSSTQAQNNYAQTRAEINAGVTPTSYQYPELNVLRYGLVADNRGAAARNTVALRALLNPSMGNGPKGNLVFPNAATYYFDNTIPIRDGIHIDLGGSTLFFAKNAYTAADDSTGFIYVQRDFTLRNGRVVVEYDGSAGTNAGDVIRIGNRGTEGDYFDPTWDALLPRPQGNVRLENLVLTSNNPGARGILMLGGLVDVVLDGIEIDGNGLLDRGIYYEFGWATNQANAEARQTSHAYNLRIRNVSVNNVAGTAVGIRGAYNYEVDGLYAHNVGSVIDGNPGEAANRNPWAPRDLTGVKRGAIWRNIVGSAITGTAVTFTGIVTRGYLVRLGAMARTSEQVNLNDYVLENFVLQSDGSPSGSDLGISTSARALRLVNGSVRGFYRGVFQTGEASAVYADGLEILDSLREGYLLTDAGNVYSPPRRKFVEFRNGRVAGSGKDGGGATEQIGIRIAGNASAVIENSRFGYSMADGDTVDEANQLTSVSVTGATARNVVVRNNYTLAVANGGTAYVNTVSSSSNGNTLDGNSGIVSAAGAWERVLRSTVTASQNTTSIAGSIEMGVGGPRIIVGRGNPERVVTATVGSIFMRTDGGERSSLYVKESGSGSQGWVAK